MDNLDYLPFGEQIAGDTGTTRKFTGQERDAETGLDYFMARHMAPGLGRFLQPDPGNVGASAGFPQTWNGYGYVANNPMSSVDPSGLNPAEAGGGCTWDPETNTLNCTGSGIDCLQAPEFCYGGPGRGPGPINVPIPPLPPSPPVPPRKTAGPKKPSCTALQAEASKLAGFLENVSGTSGWLAFGTGVGAVLAGAAEAPTAGLDTPGTITLAGMTSFFGTVSLVSGGAAASLDSFASRNTSAIWNFDVSQLTNLAARAAASRLPVVKPWAERIGDLAEQASDLALKAKGGCE